MSANARYPSLCFVNFGLGQKELARAERLHRDSLIIDLLNQHAGGSSVFDAIDRGKVDNALTGSESGSEAFYRGMMLPYELAASGESDAIKTWWDESGITVGTLQHEDLHPVPFARRQAQFNRVFGALPWLRRATTARDFREAKSDGVHAMYGFHQPMTGLPAELNFVERAYAAGIRGIMLTYNRQDFVGAGCTEKVDTGLSRYGEDVVHALNGSGILVDVSHCGPQTTLDACQLSEYPVIATHTSAKSVFFHARGKSDAELDAIVQSGGIIGVYAVPFFLTDKPNASIAAFLDHIDYIVKRAGWEYVAIGTDWPLQGPHEYIQRVLGPIISTQLGFRVEDRVDQSATLVGFSDYREFGNLVRGLISRGYGDREIQGILGENFARVFERVCG